MNVHPVAAVVLSVLAPLLTSCGQSAMAGSPAEAPTAAASPTSQSVVVGSDVSTEMTEVRYRLSDGRTVTCLQFRSWVANGGAGGLSCDWEAAK